MLRFAPSNAVSVPNMNVPSIDPKLLDEPIQESCSFVIGPVESGVSSSERSTGKAGETQPTQAP